MTISSRPAVRRDLFFFVLLSTVEAAVERTATGIARVCPLFVPTTACCMGKHCLSGVYFILTRSMIVLQASVVSPHLDCCRNTNIPTQGWYDSARYCHIIVPLSRIKKSTPHLVFFIRKTSWQKANKKTMHPRGTVVPRTTRWRPRQQRSCCERDLRYNLLQKHLRVRNRDGTIVHYSHPAYASNFTDKKHGPRPFSLFFISKRAKNELQISPTKRTVHARPHCFLFLKELKTKRVVSRRFPRTAVTTNTKAKRIF